MAAFFNIMQMGRRIGRQKEYWSLALSQFPLQAMRSPESIGYSTSSMMAGTRPLTRMTP